MREILFKAKRIDNCEIQNKPKENEYPVVVYMYRVQGYFNIDWFSIKELESEDK